MTDVRYELEGQTSKDPERWELLAVFRTKKSARKSESDWGEWRVRQDGAGWLAFRVVCVTTTREVLPSKPN